MPRRPKPKDGLTAGERVALYEAEQLERRRRMTGEGKRVDAVDSATETGEFSQTATVEEETVPEVVVQKPKKALPKPQTATVRVDLSIPVGEIKPMHGMCNGPVSYGADISGLFKEIGVPFVRFDATDTAVSAYAVDVSRIFKDPDADPSNPESYDFETTDKYVEAAMLCGAQIIYRLGESRDLLGGKKHIYDIDPEILSRAAVNIIRHYNDRWAGGYSFALERFEIWNDAMLGGDDADFELYRRLANAVKLYDEGLKVGGMSFDGFGERARSFLRFCKKTRTPVDFITFDCFGSDPKAAASDVEAFALSVRKLGFADTEIIIGKWSYIDGEALGDSSLANALVGGGEKNAAIRKKIFEEQASIRGAAYAAAFMIEMARADGVMLGCFYDAEPMISPFCAIADRFGERLKPFYAFKAFGELYRARESMLCEVAETEGYAHSGIHAAAARSQSGECYIAVASFGGCGTVDIRIDGISEELYTADLYILDGVKNLSLCDSVALSGGKKRIVLNVSEYGVVLIRLY